MPERRYRVLALATHPVQYMSPILRKMAGQPELDLHVAYCSLRGAEAGYDPEFGATVHWDMPLLEGYLWSHLPNRGSGSESFFGVCNPGVWKLIREGEFDAVLCFTGYRCATFWMALLAAKLSRTAFLFGTDAVTLRARDGRAWKVLPKRIFWPWLFRLADQVIVPSSGSRDLMYSLRLPPERVTLTPYSVDNDWWIEQSSKADRQAVRAGWGVSETDAAVLFCGKLQPWKRPLDLLRAFAKADIAKAQLVFAGEGPLRAQLENEAASLGIADRVRFLGFMNQTQLPAVYTAADVMVLSSEYEAFAVVVNEAICCGCPVIASDRVGAARDLVAPVAPEFVYPCGDVEALSKVLRSALSDRSLLASFAAAARKRIASWSPKQNISATIEAIGIAVSRIGRKGRQIPRCAPGFTEFACGAAKTFRMKLLLYSHFFAPSVGGVETIVRSLATGLAELPSPNGGAEFAVTLVTQTPSEGPSDASLGFRVIRRPSLSELHRLIRSSDVVHVAGAAIPPLLLSLLAGKPFVVEHHGFQTLCPNGQLLIEPAGTPCPGHFMAGRHAECWRCNSAQGWMASQKLWLLTFVRRFLCARASLNITPTRWLGGLLQLPRVRPIPHGLAAVASQMVPANPADPPAIVFQGRLVSTKGVRVLLDAAHALSQQKRRFELIIIGDGPERSSLEQFVREARLGDCVRFTGRLDGADLEAAFARCSLVVVPSLGGEVFGLVVAESLARGLPVIASDLGAFTEVIDGAGVTFRTGDASDLAAQIARLLDDPALAKQLGQSARTRASEFCDRSCMVEDHAAVYRSFRAAAN